MISAIIGCLLTTGLLENSIVHISSSGIIMALGAALFWAAYLMASKKSIENGKHTYTILFYSIIFISLALIPFSDFGQISSFVLINPTYTVIFLILHSTFSFAMPYILSTLSLNYMDSGTSSIVLSASEPLAALIFGFLIYSEIPTPLMFCGFLLTVTAIIMLSRNSYEN